MAYDTSWHNQPRTGHTTKGKCCPGCDGARAERERRGITPPKKKRWDTKLGQ